MIGRLSDGKQRGDRSCSKTEGEKIESNRERVEADDLEVTATSSSWEDWISAFSTREKPLREEAKEREGRFFGRVGSSAGVETLSSRSLASSLPVD